METHFTINEEGDFVETKKRQKKIRKSKIDYHVLNLGYYLAVPLLFGTFFGLLIDSKFHTQGKAVVGGILLGAIASIYNLIKLTQSNA